MAAMVQCMSHNAGTCSDEETFDLDLQEIERKYKKLQTVYHPDRFATASEVTSVHFELSGALMHSSSSRVGRRGPAK